MLLVVEDQARGEIYVVGTADGATLAPMSPLTGCIVLGFRI